MATEPSQEASIAPEQKSLGSRRRLDVALSRRKLRHRTPSFSTSHSQPTIQSELPPLGPPCKKGTTKRSFSNSGSQSISSTKPSMSVRQQSVLSMMKRTRSSGSNIRPEDTTEKPIAMFPRARSFSSSRQPRHPKDPDARMNSHRTSVLSRQIVSNHQDSNTSNREHPNQLLKESFRNKQQQHKHRQQSTPRSLSGRVDSIASRQSANGPAKTTFHVRLSIGYMTGLKIDNINKCGRHSSNNHLIVGFVELASSGKYTALSQPLLPNIGDGKTRTVKVLWANPRGGSDVSKLRRRLHFSLQLETDTPLGAQQDARDDDSFSSLGSYSPEVVKLLVGLKCGDERLILGTAKLVVNGRETFEQKMDLTVQPAPGASSKVKPKRSVFGKTQQNNHFTNGDHSFKLTPNATLRVKADIRTGLPGQDGSSVWGIDDSSYSTYWTYDTSKIHPLQNDPSINGLGEIEPNTGALAVSSFENGKLRGQMAAPGGHQILVAESGPTESQLDPDTKDHQRFVHTVPPLSIVLLRKAEDKSYMSGLTGPDVGCNGSWWSKTCFPLLLCGEAAADASVAGRGLVDKSFSFETMSQRLSGDIPAPSESIASDDSSTTVGADLNGTAIHISNNDDRLPKVSRKQPVPSATNNKFASVEQIETLDVTVETYNDLKDAQETLMRYANKVGVNMEELLDDMEQSERKSGKRNHTRHSLKH